VPDPEVSADERGGELAGIAGAEDVVTVDR
jgi:hypothetical protein